MYPAVHPMALENMVKCQLLPNRINDQSLLAAISSIPREIFVPDAYKGVAYIDDDLEIKPGRYLAEPMGVARLIQLAKITKFDRVLDIGGATGYSSAIMSHLSLKVTMLEEDACMAKQAKENFKNLGITNVDVVNARHSRGFWGKAPFEVIYIGGFAASIPDDLLSQLADGGRLVAASEVDGVKRAVIYTQSAKGLSMRSEFETSLMPLPGFEKIETFKF